MASVQRRFALSSHPGTSRLTQLTSDRRRRGGQRSALHRHGRDEELQDQLEGRRGCDLHGRTAAEYVAQEGLPVELREMVAALDGFFPAITREAA